MKQNESEQHSRKCYYSNVRGSAPSNVVQSENMRYAYFTQALRELGSNKPEKWYHVHKAKSRVMTCSFSPRSAMKGAWGLNLPC